ncbi:glycosyltransferase domain-containing protein [Leifsonia sp. NPDC058230]|uniref:glycosyltransferase domain-containing protein n=1 Tax=Leifsonia sp. NPDC058230 TaxID=3346391 RepID=UPI0036DBF5AA
MNTRRAVYTALLGGYEELSEQPVARESDLPFVCFTDRPDVTSDTWTIVPVTPLFPFDLVRSQREFKIRGHDYLAPFEETLYIDNSVHLEAPPEQILDSLLADADFTLASHSFRERVIDEFDEVVRLNYDDAGRVNEQLLHYAELYPDVLLQHPTWNGMIARRHTHDVAATMHIWFDHVLRYSRRDQLSANVAFSIGPVAPKVIDLDNNASQWHRWPVDVKRRASMGVATGRRTGPMLAEIARLEREIAALQPVAQKVNDVEAEAAARLDATQLELTDAKGRANAARAEINSIRNSVSWRMTRPIRAVGTRLRRLRSGGPTD